MFSPHLLLHVQVVIHSDHELFPHLRLTTFGTRPIYHELREVGGQAGCANPWQAPTLLRAHTLVEGKFFPCAHARLLGDAAR